MKREILNPEQACKLLAKRDKSKDFDLEGSLALQLDRAGILYEKQFKFHPARKWKADFALMESQMPFDRELLNLKILVECEGGVWKKGLGHSSGTGIARDIEKHNEAQICGYRVLRFESNAIKNGEAIRTIQRALGIGEHKNFKKGHAR